MREMPGFSGLASADFEGVFAHGTSGGAPGFFYARCATAEGAVVGQSRIALLALRPRRLIFFVGGGGRRLLPSFFQTSAGGLVPPRWRHWGVVFVVGGRRLLHNFFHRSPRAAASTGGCCGGTTTVSTGLSRSRTVLPIDMALCRECQAGSQHSAHRSNMGIHQQGKYFPWCLALVWGRRPLLQSLPSA